MTRATKTEINNNFKGVSNITPLAKIAVKPNTLFGLRPSAKKPRMKAEVKMAYYSDDYGYQVNHMNGPNYGYGYGSSMN